MIGNRAERRLLTKLNTRTLKKEYKSLSIQDKQSILDEDNRIVHTESD